MDFLEEIFEQPRVVRTMIDRCLFDEPLWDAIDRAMAQRHNGALVLTGMGSSYFALYPGCIYLNDQGVPSHMVETSELVHYCLRAVHSDDIVVIASQSGETIEVQRLLSLLKSRATIIGITNEQRGHLARNSDLSLLLHAGEERGPASKTYTAVVCVTLLMAMHLSSTMVAEQIQKLYQAVAAVEQFLGHWEGVVERTADFLKSTNHLWLLGRGPSVASALAGAVVLKEAAKIRAEGMSAGQFRHGPLEAVSPETATIIFGGEGRTKHLNLKLARDIATFGGKVVVIYNGNEQREDSIFEIELLPTDEFCSPLAEIVPIQLLAWEIAKRKGWQPGVFDKISKVTLEE